MLDELSMVLNFSLQPQKQYKEIWGLYSSIATTISIVSVTGRAKAQQAWAVSRTLPKIFGIFKS
jgi:hypothetical protein